MRPKDIGTAAESAVVRFLRANGFPNAERRALAGAYDMGDIIGIPGVVIEVKGGKEAKGASDGLITAWLAETEIERVNARADIGVLVLARAGIGPASAGRWWAVVDLSEFMAANGVMGMVQSVVRFHLAGIAAQLRDMGYGDPIESTLETA